MQFNPALLLLMLTFNLHLVTPSPQEDSELSEDLIEEVLMKQEAEKEQHQHPIHKRPPRPHTRRTTRKFDKIASSVPPLLLSSSTVGHPMGRSMNRRKLNVTNQNLTGEGDTLGQPQPEDQAEQEDEEYDLSAGSRSSSGSFTQDSPAKWGDPCLPTQPLELDYCERAPYPNKYRMICSSKEMSPDRNWTSGVCVCKFAKHRIPKTDRKSKSKFVTIWKQMTYNSTLNLCMSPEGGMCYLEYPTGGSTEGKSTYKKNQTMANTQCEPNKTLTCSKPHPRRFRHYNAYHHYCLKPEDRLPGSSQAGLTSRIIPMIISTSILLKRGLT